MGALADGEAEGGPALGGGDAAGEAHAGPAGTGSGHPEIPYVPVCPVFAYICTILSYFIVFGPSLTYW